MHTTASLLVRQRPAQRQREALERSDPVVGGDADVVDTAIGEPRSIARSRAAAALIAGTLSKR
jgi:hypothetical protein